jgi:hypothetical protein
MRWTGIPAANTFLGISTATNVLKSSLEIAASRALDDASASALGGVQNSTVSDKNG